MRFKKISAILLAILLVVVLAACKDKFKKPVINIVEENAIREKITLDFKIDDQDDVLTEVKVTLVQNNDKDFTRTNTINLSDEEDYEYTTIFTSLKVETTYTITFNGSYDGKAHKMLERELTTSKAGSKEEPHQIKTFEDLKNVKNDEEGYYRLMNDIDVTEGDESNKNKTSKTNLTPFFTSTSTAFAGRFESDPNSSETYKISNFKIDSTYSELGLFGMIAKEGVIEDVDFSDIEVTTNRSSDFNLGVIAGTNRGTIKDVDINNVVITTKSNSDSNQVVGGVVGANLNKIENVNLVNLHIDASLPASATVGGFVGENHVDDATNAVIPSIKNASVVNAFLDLSVQNKSGIDDDTSEEDTTVDLVVGGFAGDNRGYIENSATTNKILIYADGTTLDGETNPTLDEDGNPETFEVKETERNSYIDNFNLTVGGFVGKHENSDIIGSGANTSFGIDLSYLDNLILGGFAGASKDGKITGAGLIINGEVNILTNDDVNLEKIINEGESNEETIYLLGQLVGVDNNSRELDITLEAAATFSLTLRTSTETDGEFTYTYSAPTAPTLNPYSTIGAVTSVPVYAIIQNPYTES